MAIDKPHDQMLYNGLHVATDEIHHNSLNVHRNYSLGMFILRTHHQILNLVRNIDVIRIFYDFLNTPRKYMQRAGSGASCGP